ncbi:transposase [Rhizobium hainanense]|uniref:transposase n=1 Tax=Rhizobium hainanense TaxID=52131 RepID=UPI003CC8040F
MRVSHWANSGLGDCLDVIQAFDGPFYFDAQWAKMERYCLGKPTDSRRGGSDNRPFIEAALWIVRVSSPWHDLPEHFGNWGTALLRFSDWRRGDVFAKLL